MSIKERINDIFDRYNVQLSAVANEDAEQAAALELEATAKLENGTEVKTDEDSFEAGAEVYVENEEKEKITLPDGNYKMEDGREMKVENGQVTEVKAGDHKEDEKMEDDKKEEMATEALTKEDVAGRIAEAIEGLRSDFAKAQEDTKEEFSKPAAAPLPKVAKEQPRQEVNLLGLSAKDRVAAISEIYINR